MDKEFLRQIDRLDEYLSTPEKLENEALICECFCVSAGDIREACAGIQKVDLALLQNNFSLGHGCQSCLKQFESWAYKIF
jgi:NAD(P)H-nitrite reductase large subunit